jgi:C6 transcription factor Pro1
MAPGRKQGDGCWTCRLRRKRCDAVRPACGSCQALAIPCHAGEARPSWMDGGVGQRQMAETIKLKIRHNALVRRERRLHTSQHQSILSTESDLSDGDGAPATRSVFSAVSHAVSPTRSAASILPNSPAGPIIVESSSAQSEWSQSSLPAAPSTSDSGPSLTACSPNSPWSAGSVVSGVPSQVEFGSVMIYLDYVFPFLFPFYQPPLIETGRQWLLGLVCQNELSFHTAASLSAYFFTLVPQKNGQEIHDECKAVVWDGLVKQMDMAFRAIQSEVAATSQQGNHCSLIEKVRLMEEITQLLILDVTVRRDVNWSMHLTPALSLIDEVFKDHGMVHSKPDLDVLLGELPPLPLPPTTPHQKPLPNTADQSALVFFTSLLLLVDIVASTTLGKSPSLQSYHGSLLTPQEDGKCSLRLESVIGCQNWVIICVGEISALCGWKSEVTQNGTFSVVDLVRRAECISLALEKGLESLNTSTLSPNLGTTTSSRLEAYYTRHDKGIDSASTATATRVWAHAAKLYLAVTLSGWQTNCAEVQESVERVLCLLQTIESPARLRSLSWPLCIAGCLALPDQEEEFRMFVRDMGELRDFGTLAHAMRIMEAVWASRYTVDRTACDIAAFLGILGPPALLI